MLFLYNPFNRRRTVSFCQLQWWIETHEYKTPVLPKKSSSYMND
jgi:hypothetical protein